MSNYDTVNEGWQERAGTLCKPEGFSASVDAISSIWEALTPQERTRLRWKLGLVNDIAKHLACGMLKGTIKYPDDGEDNIDYWLHHLANDSIDSTNYLFLLLHTLRG